MAKSRSKKNANLGDPAGQIPEEAYAYALTQLEKGHDAVKVAQCLVEAGYSEAEAEKIMVRVINKFKGGVRSTESALQDGKTLMYIGLGALIVGVIVTAGSMLTAGPGGTYYVAGGLIASGFVMVIRAQSRMSR